MTYRAKPAITGRARHRQGQAPVVLILLLVPALFVLIAVTLACTGSSGPENFLILSVDTLRADHLGCYGYNRQTSPFLDTFAREGVLYENCLAPAPWTLPSHVAMLSGRHPIAAGITGAANSIPDSLPMVAERFAAAGFETAAFVDSKPKGFVGAERGFDRGFQTFRHAPLQSKVTYKYDMSTTVDTALEWLAGRDKKKPFFLFLHTKSVHTNPANRSRRPDPRRFPYDKPKPYVTMFLSPEGKRFKWVDERAKAVDYLKTMNKRIAGGEMMKADYPPERLQALEGLYDAGIYYVDEHFNRLMQEFRRMGLDKNTVVLVTADHGESFLEHQLLLHQEVHRQVLHVPLILRLPGATKRGVRLNQPVTLADIVPTLLQMAGLEPTPGLHGRVLPLAGEAPAKQEARFASYRWGPDSIYEGYSLEEGRWTIIHHRLGSARSFSTTLYDTQSDPGQFRPVTDRPRVTRLLLKQLDQRLKSEVRGEEIILDQETKEHLRALGYLR